MRILNLEFHVVNMQERCEYADYQALMIMCCVCDARLKHRQAVLSNLLHSHLPLRYSSADEEHCSSTPATLAAACCEALSSKLAGKGMTPIHRHLRRAPHHLILDALSGRPGVGE